MNPLIANIQAIHAKAAADVRKEAACPNRNRQRKHRQISNRMDAGHGQIQEPC